MTLPDGRLVALPPQQTWPSFSDRMPWAEKIEDLSVSGEPVVLVDNTERINAELLAWNQPQGWQGYRADAINQNASSLRLRLPHHPLVVWLSSRARPRRPGRRLPPPQALKTTEENSQGVWEFGSFLVFLPHSQTPCANQKTGTVWSCLL